MVVSAYDAASSYARRRALRRPPAAARLPRRIPAGVRPGNGLTALGGVRSCSKRALTSPSTMCTACTAAEASIVSGSRKVCSRRAVEVEEVLAAGVVVVVEEV